MATDLVLPELGENIQTGVVAQILVDVGDHVETDQPLIEIETDKAVVEVPSTLTGVVTAIFVETGDAIEIGQKIIAIEDDAKAAAIAPETPPTPSKKTGDSDKGEISMEAKPQKTAPEPEPEEKPKSGGKPSLMTEVEAVAPAAPSVRRFAREIGVDIHRVPGNGPGGRISMEDVKKYARSHRVPEGAFPDLLRPAANEPLPDFAQWGEVRKEPISMVRKITAAHVRYAWSTIPQVTQFDQADMTELEKFRKKYGPKVQAAGGKLTVTAMLMKIVAGAMSVFPHFNAAIDMDNEEIIYKKYFHIGVAVDTERGLLVPVVRHVDRMNLIEISTAVSQKAQKARDGKLSPDEMKGGNFTISNLGGIGGTAFTPIINAPEVAILGVSRSSRQPRYAMEKQPEPRLILPLSLTYDHRIIDGAAGARFLRWIVDAIEQPLLLTLGG